jgi:hypothetical protein
MAVVCLPSLRGVTSSGAVDAIRGSDRSGGGVDIDGLLMVRCVVREGLGDSNGAWNIMLCSRALRKRACDRLDAKLKPLLLVVVEDGW